MAVSPCVPRAWNVFRSAWIPAPPPESEPAMVRVLGLALTVMVEGYLQGRSIADESAPTGVRRTHVEVVCLYFSPLTRSGGSRRLPFSERLRREAKAGRGLSDENGRRRLPFLRACYTRDGEAEPV